MADFGKYIMRKIIKDVKVKLDEEFSKNFERQAFFSEHWQRRKSPIRQNGHLLIDSGLLRSSIKGKADELGVTFSSDRSYAAIHNNGGEIRVTQRMKGWFWIKYRETVGNFKRKKNGELSKSKAQVKLSTEAEFYKAMALKKVGSVIKIPKRRFLGVSPEVEKIVTEIVNFHLKEAEKYLVKQLKQLEKK